MASPPFMYKFSSRSLFCSVIFFVALFYGAPAAQSQALPFLSDSTSYLWPTDATRYLSSTFAETRSAHLHAGIDIRTWGREGYEVYATRDGFVHRIGISASGYGKVIYLQHDDGSYSVYAHLQRFEPRLRAYADSIRMQDHRFELDHLPEEAVFTYKKGDIIGYTGSTGVGPPHLHFELRTPDFRPFNPLLTNLQVRDDIAPTISALAIESLHPNSLHYQSYRIIEPLADRNDTPHFGTLFLDSPAGLAVEVYDEANRTPNKYAVHALTLIAGQDTLFHSTVDEFGYDTSQMMFLDRSYPILAEKKRGFQRLYIANGNRLSFYRSVKNRGILALEAGEYDIRIIAEDLYGNRSSAKATVIFGNDSASRTITSVPAYPIVSADVAWQHQPIPPTTLKPVPAFAIGRPVHTKSPAGPVKGNRYRAASRQLKQPTPQQLLPERRHTLSSPENRAWLEIPADALYDTLSVLLTYEDKENLPVIRFTPGHLPVDAPMTLSLILPESIADAPGIGLYSYDEYRSKFTYIDSDITNGLLRARIAEFSELRIRRDRTAPWIGIPKQVKDAGGSFIVHLPVVDQNSGIDYRRSTITINGVRGITEYDKDKNLLIYYHPNFLSGDDSLRVEARVYDRVGNLSDRTFTIPASSN
ncbi:MAG: peptidoglycan DD-metalloendopeptidase family protein [Bacteroidetes bacterium]|nr:peptidoglycan DD-metalloendopeptidase family protein [Bacteroidota bacterium]